MFLKSVKARGFKSFARPVEFALEPGITVVVGPNGSGKSNISDAVTWAMGEQSPSAVRGNTMQDVIFSGSDKLAPAGMAEVEILFDNSDGSIPIEFSEVLVSRRLYRDGEGSYFINRSAARLIDVTELLSDAGLGKNTHSIISQGKVDAILESKPRERRAFIEEAAGLGKYKKRRHRAERKLEAVRRNLERLFDVEEEVRANLRPLKRQATAAERSARLDQQIAAAQSRYIKGKLEVLSTELAAAKASADDAGARRSQLEGQLALAAAERRRTEELLAGSLQEHKQLAARFYALKSQREGLDSQSSAVAQRLEMLDGARKRAQTRIDNLQGQIERVQSELAHAQTEHKQDLARLAEVESGLAARQSELDAVELEIARRREATEEKKRRVGELSALKDRYTHQIDYLERRQEKLAGMIERAELEAQSRRRDLERLLELSRGEEERMAKWRRKAEAAESALRDLTARRNEVHGRRQEAASELRRVSEDLQIAKARLTFLGDSDRDRSGLPPAAKKLAEDHGLRALMEIIEVEPGYEQAVSAVLGSALFALAARDMKHASELLKAARAAELGRVEFALPSAGSQAVQHVTPAGERQPEADYLIEHVRIPAEWDAHVTPLLAGIRIVEEAAEMMDAAGQARAPGPASDGSHGGPVSWVTREGVVYDAQRRLLGYKADPPSSVVLRQRNERRHLEEERHVRETRHEQLQNSVAVLEQESGQVSAACDQAEKALHDVLQERRQTEGNAAATQRQRQVLEQEIELRQASGEHLGAEAQKIGEELAEARQRLAETEHSLAAIGAAAADEAAGSDENLAAVRLELSQKVTELKISAARVRERERVAGQSIERSAPVLQRLRREAGEARYQLAAFSGLQPVYVRLAASMERLAGVFTGVLEVLARQLREGEELAERHSSSLRELSQAEAELQQELSKASNANTDCEVSVTRLRDQVADHEQRLQKLFERYPDADLDEEEAAAVEQLEEVEAQIERLLRRRELIGPVNPLAQQEYEEMLERQEFLSEQRRDLEQSLDELNSLIHELTARIENDFASTFAAVRDHFSDVIGTLFPGGEGRLTLTREEEPDGDEEDEEMQSALEDGEEEAEDEAMVQPAAGRADRRGIEISVKPPRKAVRSLSLLSGGERSLVAIGFLFAIFLARPAPFYILDEVEAALDDHNIDRLLGMLRRYQTRTQFIIITHQKRTMEVADTLYGISMNADGTSKVLSRKMKKEEAEARPPEARSEATADPDDPEQNNSDEEGAATTDSDDELVAIA